LTSVIFFFFLLASSVGLLVGNLKSAPRPSVVPPRAFARLTRPRPAPTPNAFLQEIHGNRWALVAAELPGKTGQQCAQRWRHKVNPNIKKEKWSAEEDAQVRRDERPARAKARLLAPARARRERERPAPEPRAAHSETRSVEMHARGPTNTRRPPPGRKKQRRDVASRGVIRLVATGSIVTFSRPMLSVPRRVGKKATRHMPRERGALAPCLPSLL